VEDEHQLYIDKPKIGLKRAFIFWDHANIFHNLQELNARIDYGLAKRMLGRNYHVAAAIMYVGIPNYVFPKKYKFFKALENIGWLISEKPLKVLPSGKLSQQGVDEKMFLDIYDLAKDEAYEKAIIVSGDNIFVDVIRELKKVKAEIEVWSFRKSLSRALVWEVGKEYIFFLDDVLEEISLKDKKIKK
jgi:uncharacterized LabA/DUF88 family protein